VNLTPLLTSFVLVFLAELGDKTLYTVLLLSARSRALPVLIGACAAFVVQGMIAVGLGSLLALLPAKWIHWLTAAIFLFFGLLLLFKEESPHVQRTSKASNAGRMMLTTFGLVFAAEWGDATQIGSAALVARFRAPVQVFVGATLGLWLGTALAVMVGGWLGSRLPTRMLRKAAGVVFCAFAIVVAIKSV
jgi:putative Ca2+/H+ antiporter (TMEM165/GDT1 family)